jgi:hypothetical protein
MPNSMWALSPFHSLMTNFLPWSPPMAGQSARLFLRVVGRKRGGSWTGGTHMLSSVGGAFVRGERASSAQHEATGLKPRIRYPRNIPGPSCLTAARTPPRSHDGSRALPSTRPPRAISC